MGLLRNVSPSIHAPSVPHDDSEELRERSASFVDTPGFVALVEASDRASAVATVASMLGRRIRLSNTSYTRAGCPSCSSTVAIFDDGRAVCTNGCASILVVSAIGERARAEAERLTAIQREQAERAATAERARADRERVEAERQARERDPAMCTLAELPSPTRAWVDVYTALGYDELDGVNGSDDRRLGMSVSTLFEGAAGAVIEGVPVPVPAHA